MSRTQTEHVELIEPLDGRGEALLKKNLHEGETVLVKLKGIVGEVFVVTDSNVYILKYGSMTGHTFGGHCVAYGFNQITGIEINRELRTGFLEVLTATDSKKSYWTKKLEDKLGADNMVSFVAIREKVFQGGVSLARGTIQKSLNAHNAAIVEHQSAADEVEKLASLRDKGILTEEEFQAKKRQLLGL